MKSRKRLNWKNLWLLSLITFILAFRPVSTMIFAGSEDPLNDKRLGVTVASSSTTKMYVSPPSLVDPDLTPGEMFTIDINVSDVEDLYIWNLYLSWDVPLLDVLWAIEGPFLKEGGETIMTQKAYNDEGYILIANTLKGFVPGVDGSGTLVSVWFKVEGTGASILDLYGTVLGDSQGNPIYHTAEDGYFDNRVAVTHTLTVNSDPISGIEFTIDGVTQTTSWSGSLAEGSHTIEMPTTWTAGTDVYNFDHWEDASTDPTRIIDLTADMTVTAYYVLAPIYWTLTVNSDPISGVEFTIDSAVHTTPWSDSLVEGTYTVVMPSTWTVDTDVYYFDHWEDTSTDPTRVIDLTSDMTLTAYYVKRQWTLTVTSDPISGIDFTVDGLTQTTPWSGLLDEGDHTIEMPSTWGVYDFDHWEDASTSPSRTISLTGDTTITAYYVKRQWTLTVNSDPIDGVEFTVDDIAHATPWSSLLDEGSYTVVMPMTWTTATGDVYQFNQWEDTSTNPSRTVSLTSDMSITAYYEYVPKTYTLTVNSDPITGVEFTIDATTQYTPWTGDLSEGSHTIVMPSSWTVGTDVYYFDHWEDTSTSPSRTISLTADMTVTAYYVLAPPTYWTLTVNSDPMDGVEFTVDGVTHTTPWSDSLVEGTYTIVMPSTWGIYDFDHWEDASTSPSRTISLTGDTTITAYYVKRQWTLTVNSDPISGVDFTLDGAAYVTPWSGLLDEGSYTVAMPSTWFVGADEYTFVQWEDLSTNPTRTISLTADTTIVAYYEYVPKEFTLTVNSSPITGIDFTVDDIAYTTDWSGLLQEGTHTIVMPTTWTTPEGDTYQFDHWEDDSTDPTRVIDLTTDMTLTAYYEYAPVTYKLTVNSDPITGVEFTIDGVAHVTPWTGDLAEDSYTIVMPTTWTTTTGDVYDFDQWEDMSTDPTRTISLTADMTITAHYMLAPPPETRVYVAPSISVADPGQTVTVTIEVQDVTDLFAWEFFLSWDPEILYTDETMVTEGDFLNQGMFPTTFVKYVTAYYMQVSCLLQIPMGVSGSGTLAQIQFEVVGTGQSSLDLYDTSLRDPMAVSITHTSDSGVFQTTYPVAYFFFYPSSKSFGGRVPEEFLRNPLVGEVVTFNASESYDPDGTIVSYDWDFGDGTTGSGMIVTHAYTAPGTYNIILTVTDNDAKTDTRQESATVVLHDLVITNIEVYPTIINPGKEPFPKIEITVLNNGTVGEYFNLTCYYDNNPIWYNKTLGWKAYMLYEYDEQGFRRDPLGPDKNIIIIFTWNTTGVAEGTYNIWANVSRTHSSGIHFLPGEHTPADNIYDYGEVVVTELPPEDTTPPTIVINEPFSQDYLHSEAITIDFEVTDLQSGVASVAATLDGAPVTDGQVVELFTLSLGEHTFTVTAVDNAGNTAAETVTFNVIATIDSLIALVDKFYELGFIDEQDIQLGLKDKLIAAKAKIEQGKIRTAMNILNAFLKQLKAQSGKHITVEAADILMADAEHLLNHL